MDKKELKLLSECYDKLYDFNVFKRYEFESLLDKLNDYAINKGYTFKLNKRDKWQCVKVKQ